MEFRLKNCNVNFDQDLLNEIRRRTDELIKQHSEILDNEV